MTHTHIYIYIYVCIHIFDMKYVFKKLAKLCTNIIALQSKADW